MKILFRSPWFPFLPDNSSKILIYQLLQALGKQHEVVLLSFAEAATAGCSDTMPDFLQLAGMIPRIEFQPRRALRRRESPLLLAKSWLWRVKPPEVAS